MGKDTPKGSAIGCSARFRGVGSSRFYPWQGTTTCYIEPPIYHPGIQLQPSACPATTLWSPDSRRSGCRPVHRHLCMGSSWMKRDNVDVPGRLDSSLLTARPTAVSFPSYYLLLILQGVGPPNTTNSSCRSTQSPFMQRAIHAFYS